MRMYKVANNPPRTWSSYTNVHQTKDDKFKMNSVEDIRQYRENIYCSPTLRRKTSATTYDFPEHPPKKDKKWSLGSLFRRKKKDESNSTSEEEQVKKGFLSKKKKKSEKRKKNAKQRTTFDHIVVPNSRDTLYNNGYFYDESGILSDPTGGFGSYQGRTTLSRTPQQVRKLPKTETARDISNRNVMDGPSLGSADSLIKRNRKDMAKLRAEARRETHLCGSSSDEDSQRSASSSRLKSDENISVNFIRNRDGSLSKKSRSARTERYVRRLSKDEEPQQPNLRSSKSDLDNGYRRLMLPEKKEKPRSPKAQRNSKVLSPLVSSVSGLATIPPSHHNNHKRNSRDSVSSPNFTKPPISNVNKYGSLTSNDPKENFTIYQRSISYDADIHRSTSPEMQQNEVIHAQLPLGKPSQRYRNLSLVEQPRLLKQRQPPPPPPPRDPWRILTTQHLESQRPISYCFERSQQRQNIHDLNHRMEPKPHSFNWKPNFRSTSEDYLPCESSPIPFHPRSASATSDHPKQRIVRKTIGGTDASEHYQYLTDKNPRSRKPIFIQSFTDDSKNEVQRQNESKKAIDFWKKIDQDVSRMQEKTQSHQRSEPNQPLKNNLDIQKAVDFWKLKDEEKKSIPTSPKMFTVSTHVRTNIFLPSALKPEQKVDFKRSPSPFKPIQAGNDVCDGFDGQHRLMKNGSLDSITNEITKSPTNDRKSSNLEDALDELEAIYNSLRLGDEDLLERAEEREKSIAAKKIMDANLESYPGWAPVCRGAISDSSFSYEPFDSVDSPKRKRFLKRKNPDRRNDDMALRKLNKERSKTISDPKEAMSKVSYLLASPLHGNELETKPSKSYGNEPDITFDDVVFRTIKHANNTLKVSDPQPPFGIPVGTVLPAPNSDYLHAMPEETSKYQRKNKKIPDIVKDDLAFRNLRKDLNKEPVLPTMIHDDFLNNNNNSIVNNLKSSFGSIKKKRAIRSLSANIYNLIQNDPFVYPCFTDEEREPRESEKSNLSDIADAMEIARQILKEKEERISATRKAFLSDSEAKYKKKDGNHLNETKLNFLSSMKSKEENAELQQKVIVNVPKNDSCIQSKPPKGLTPERKLAKDSPSPIDFTKDESYRSSLDDLLTAFAVEAQQASKRIKDEIKASDNEKRMSWREEENKLTSPGLVFEARKNSSPALGIENYKASSPILGGDQGYIEQGSSRQNSSLPIPSIFSSIENRNISSPPRTLHDLIPSSSIEDYERIDPPKQFSNEGEAPIAEPEIIPMEEDEESEVPNEGTEELIVSVDESRSSPVQDVDSDHDYVNMGSDAEFDKAIPLIDDCPEEPKCKSPFEEHKAELIAGFQELKNIESVENDRVQRLGSPMDVSVDESRDGVEESDGEGGEDCVFASNALTSEDRECAYLTESFVKLSDSGSIASYVSDCDIPFTRMPVVEGPKKVDTQRQSNESPQSSGFHSNSISDNDEFHSDKFVDFTDALLGLKSPKLVLDSINNRSKFDGCDEVDAGPSTSRCSPANSPKSTKGPDQNSDDDRSQHKSVSIGRVSNDQIKPRISRESRECPNEVEPSDAWFVDPIVLAFACSYGFACTYQMVNTDVVALLGLLFVIISFVAALIL